MPGPDVVTASGQGPGRQAAGRQAVGRRAVVIPAAIALACALGVILVGLASYGFDITRFTHAGTYYVTSRPGLRQQPGAGYDGQFVYRLSLAPFDLHRTAFGITFDTPLRTQRIGLPLLAWLLSAGGRAAAVPLVLVAIDVAAVVVVAGLGGHLAARWGRDPRWGLLLAAPTGFLFGLLHDLTEPLEVALLLLGLLLWWSGRGPLAGLVWAGAALTRETALILVLAVALPRLAELVRRRRPEPVDLAWLVPFGVWAGWQAYAAAATGSTGAGQGSRDNLGYPLAGIVGVARAIPGAAWHEWPLFVVQVLLFLFILARARRHLRSAPAPVPLATAFYLVFALLLATPVWAGWDDLRFLVEPTVLLALVLLRSDRDLRTVGYPAAAVWLLSLAVNRQ